MSTQQELKQQGNIHFQNDDFEKAIEYYTLAIEKDAFCDEAADALLSRSQCYSHLGKYKEAYEDAGCCCGIRPDWAKGFAQRGETAEDMSQYEIALESYQEFFRIAESNENSNNNNNNDDNNSNSNDEELPAELVYNIRAKLYQMEEVVSSIHAEQKELQNDIRQEEKALKALSRNKRNADKLTGMAIDCVMKASFELNVDRLKMACKYVRLDTPYDFGSEADPSDQSIQLVALFCTLSYSASNPALPPQDEQLKFLDAIFDIAEEQGFEPTPQFYKTSLPPIVNFGAKVEGKNAELAHMHEAELLGKIYGLEDGPGNYLSGKQTRCETIRKDLILTILERGKNYFLGKNATKAQMATAVLEIIVGGYPQAEEDNIFCPEDPRKALQTESQLRECLECLQTCLKYGANVGSSSSSRRNNNNSNNKNNASSSSSSSSPVLVRSILNLRSAKVVELLLRHNASVDATHEVNYSQYLSSAVVKRSITPLSAAFMKCNADCVRIIMSAGGKLSIEPLELPKSVLTSDTRLKDCPLLNSNYYSDILVNVDVLRNDELIRMLFQQVAAQNLSFLCYDPRTNTTHTPLSQAITFQLDLEAIQLIIRLQRPLAKLLTCPFIRRRTLCDQEDCPCHQSPDVDEGSLLDMVEGTCFSPLGLLVSLLDPLVIPYHQAELWDFEKSASLIDYVCAVAKLLVLEGAVDFTKDIAMSIGGPCPHCVSAAILIDSMIAKTDEALTAQLPRTDQHDPATGEFSDDDESTEERKDVENELLVRKTNLKKLRDTLIAVTPNHAIAVETNSDNYGNMMDFQLSVIKDHSLRFAKACALLLDGVMRQNMEQVRLGLKYSARFDTMFPVERDNDGSGVFINVDHKLFLEDQSDSRIKNNDNNNTNARKKKKSKSSNKSQDTITICTIAEVCPPSLFTNADFLNIILDDVEDRLKMTDTFAADPEMKHKLFLICGSNAFPPRKDLVMLLLKRKKAATHFFLAPAAYTEMHLPTAIFQCVLMSKVAATTASSSTSNSQFTNDDSATQIHLECIQACIRAGADVNRSHPLMKEDAINPVFESIFSLKSPKILDQILSAGASTDVPIEVPTDVAGETILMNALELCFHMCYIEFARMLISHGAQLLRTKLVSNFGKHHSVRQHPLFANYYFSELLRRVNSLTIHDGSIHRREDALGILFQQMRKQKLSFLVPEDGGFSRTPLTLAINRRVEPRWIECILKAEPSLISLPCIEGGAKMSPLGYLIALCASPSYFSGTTGMIEKVLEYRQILIRFGAHIDSANAMVIESQGHIVRRMTGYEYVASTKQAVMRGAPQLPPQLEDAFLSQSFYNQSVTENRSSNRYGQATDDKENRDFEAVFLFVLIVVVIIYFNFI